MKSLRQARDEIPYLVSYPAVVSERLFFISRTACQSGWVVEACMQAPCGPGEDGTGLSGVVAHRDDPIEFFVFQCFERFRPLPGNIDTHLLHDPYGQRIERP